MIVDTENLISITEANQNFSRAGWLLNEHGSAVILKNNVLRYPITDLQRVEAA